MIKIFEINETNFNTNGLIAINPIKCIETKLKSLNGWYIDVEIPIEYNDYIIPDYLCVIKTKSKITPQAFRIGKEETIQRSNRKIIFKAIHVALIDAKDYFLVDVRPTDLNGSGALYYINERIDNISPFSIHSDVETKSTAYFIRKNLLEAWTIIEERWSGYFDFDNWTVYFKQSLGNDRGQIVSYGKNLKAINIIEDWSNVITRIYPTGPDGIMLPEKFIDSGIQYDRPYTRTISFNSEIEFEEQTEDNLIEELRENAIKYLESNKFPLFSYELDANIDESLDIGDKVHVKHPLVDLVVEVIEYQYNTTSKLTKRMVFGNFSRNVKAKFDYLKGQIVTITDRVSRQEQVVNNQTNIINNLNKNGILFIDNNELLVLNELPKEVATQVLRLGLGGIGFGTSYEGPFTTAWTLDGTFNANFITTGTMSVNRIEGLSAMLDENMQSISNLTLTSDNISIMVEETRTNLNNNYMTSEQVEAKISGNTGEIEALRNMTQQLQNSTSIINNIVQEISQNGVTRVQTTSGVFDENGLTIYKSGEEFNALMSNSSFSINRNNFNIFLADTTGVYAENLYSRTFIILANKARQEIFQDDFWGEQVGNFWLGDD